MKLTHDFETNVLAAQHNADELETLMRMDERGEPIVSTELHGLALRLLYNAQRIEAMAARFSGRQPLFPE